jgi:hypothetical protein
MKRFQNVAACFVALALMGVASLKSAEPVRVQGKAIVRSFAGTASCTTAAGVARKLRVNMELEPGATITTGPDSFVYLHVNGLASTVRIAAETTLSIPLMDRLGSDRLCDTQTLLDLKLGEIVGQVKKKISDASIFEIKTPHGAAGSRGGDFVVIVVQLPGGKSSETFFSGKGKVVVSAIVKGETQVKTLKHGEAWTPGAGLPHAATPALINEYRIAIGLEPVPYLRPIPYTGGAVSPVVTNMMPVFPTGGPPGGGATRPAK